MCIKLYVYEVHLRMHRYVNAYQHTSFITMDRMIVSSTHYLGIMSY